MYLQKRLALWREGRIEELLRELKTIQRKITQPRRKPSQNLEREGHSKGPLEFSDNVQNILGEKHPKASDMMNRAVLKGCSGC